MSSLSSSDEPAADGRPEGRQGERAEEAVPIPNRIMQGAEEIIYLGASAVLLVGAAALLVKAGWHLATDLGDGVEETVRDVLDTLLLTFVLVELLAAVRLVLQERQLLAEPFILVGIIAIIKEVVVTSIEAGENVGTDTFADTMTDLGVLTGVLLVLAIASFLIRRKEQEPAETD